MVGHQGELQPNGTARRGIPLLVTFVPGRSIERIIGKLADFEYEVAAAESVEELFDTTKRDKPDAIVLGGAGAGNLVWLVSRLVEIAPQTAVVAMFDRPDEAELLAVIHAGAVGYLPTTISPERLVAAIDSALDGVPAIPRSMTATLVRQLRSPGCIILPSVDNQGFELSAREWDVLCLMQQGCTTNEIAERLFVCPATVRSHVSAIENRLGVPDRAAALAAVFAS